MAPNELLAKSNGQTLIEHSKSVATLAEEIACSMGFNSTIRKLCYFAGLFHDIGKAISPFQSKLSRDAHDASTIPGCNARHSAIGAWFIANHYTTFDRLVPGLKGGANEILCKAIAWHHKPYLPIEDSRFDFDPQFDAEIKEFVNALQDGMVWDNEDSKNFNLNTTKFKYFDKENDYNGQSNLRTHAVRSIIIRADYLASEGATKWEGVPTFDKIVPSEIQCPDMFDRQRFERQLYEIAIPAIDSGKKSVVINAPAGFGKTLIGLMAGLYRGEKMYWVVPRNVIAEEVYRSITDLLKLLNLDNKYSVNLVYGGAIQAGSETADITVTNIDAILQPMGQHGKMGLQCDMIGGTMVFDEYHELIGKTPMWSAFITLMGARMSCNSRNILISATPLDVLSLVDADPSEVLYLPSKNTHYPAQHSVPYSMKTAERIPSAVSGDTFLICNAISRVQEVDCGLMFHSKYTRDDRDKISTELFDSFGKNKTCKISGVSAGPILSTSLDISCTHLIESVCSPMDTLQRIGRCNRFGNKEHCSVTFVTGSMPGERDYVKMKFTPELREQWRNALIQEFDGKDITLDEMYRFYDRFCAEHAIELKKWLKDLLKDSFDCLVERCAPSAIISDTPTKGKQGNGTIRNPEPNLYYIVQADDGKRFYGPFSIDLSTAYGPKYGKVFKQVNNLDEYKRANTISPELVTGTTRYLSGNKNKREWYKNNADKMARNADSPFVVPARYMTYDSFKGIAFHGKEEDAD